MRIDRDIRLTGRGYELYLGLHPGGLDRQEAEVFMRHGDVPVECGGTVVDKDMDVVLCMQEESRMFPSQFPVRKLFPFGMENANDAAVAVLETLTSRLAAARDRHLENHPLQVGLEKMEI